MMKLVAIACLVVVAGAVVKNDEWCHEHHLASGSASCVKWGGCCFSAEAEAVFDGSQALGPCHSCERHLDSWCEIYGGYDIDQCLVHSGCTFDSDTNKCKSAEPEPMSSVRTCYTHFEDAVVEIQAYTDCIAAASVEECQESYAYKPECSLENSAQEYLAEQTDEGGPGPDNYFCVDKNGHEIPDTRKQSPLKIWHIDCEKKRRESKGYQCPNAITLTTRGGVVIVNEDNDATDCAIHCNTDRDCTGGHGEWCCFNGCGYKCKQPVLPMSGCAEVPGNPVQKVTGHEGGTGHGVEIDLGCADGYDIIPVTGPQQLTLTCKHGNWETLDGRKEFESDVDCLQKCQQFAVTGDGVDGRPLRERDYVVKGAENRWATAEVTVSCQPGYGVIGGTQRSKDSGEEKLSCTQGSWKTAAGNARAIECSVCFDAYPHQWKDDRNNTCSYYSARPMECNKNGGARANCRVSCRSCGDAEEMYKVRNVRENLVGVPEEKRNMWRRVEKRVANTRVRTVIKTRQVEITSNIPMNEACTDGAGTNARKVDGVCPTGFTPL